jgi:nicotinamide mononucleotide transporter
MHIIHAVEHWWQQQSLLEVIGVITGLLCVWLAAINNIWNWPIAIISVGIYIYIFFFARLYADMGLQVYFMVMNIYGWYYWAKEPDDATKMPIVIISRKELWWSIPAIVVFTVILGTGLKYTPASYPYLDSFCTACSLVAQVWLARKILENWLIWLFVDIVYVGVYILKGLDLTAVMYAIYVGLALFGYLDWKKDYKKQPVNIT